MKFSLVSATVLATLGAAVSLWCFRTRIPTPTTAPFAPAGSHDGTRCLSRLPASFVPNLGQWPHAAQYVAHIGATTVFLESDGWTLTQFDNAPVRDRKGKGLHDCATSTPVRGVALRMTFCGARARELVPECHLPGRHNYFLGNDPAKWRTDVPLYGAVRYREMHPGIDVRVREHERHFEYDLILQPDALLETVEIEVAGAERLYLDAEGALVMQTKLGPVRMPPPVCWEEAPSGERSPIGCSYELRGSRLGFAVTGRRPGWALVVDPGLIWSTSLGGPYYMKSAGAIAVDAQGATYVAGWTETAFFPTTPGAFDTTFNDIITSPSIMGDAFVAKLSATGSSLVYSTFLGGMAADHAAELSVDAQGTATVAGGTESPDFPTTPGAFDTTYNGGGSDAFVARLSPSGSSLVYSTLLGGSGTMARESVTALSVDAQGAATVAGYTQSTDFPTTPGAFDTTYNGGGTYGSDAFVARLSPSGSSLVYSTFLGGMASDGATALSVDAQGAATVAGSTESTNFPTTPGTFGTTFNGVRDGFITRLSPSGSSLVYSTYLGGTMYEYAYALSVDAQGVAAVAGVTTSSDFPTTPGAFDTTYSGGDAFITRLSPSGSNLVYSTYLGGTLADGALALSVDAQGTATVAGYTQSTDFPTTLGAFDTTFNGGAYNYGDAFVARLSATGSSLVYSTFLGGTSDDNANALSIDAQGAATVAGTAAFGGDWDVFVTRLDMLPSGVTAFGRSSPGCTGPLAIGVNSMPQVGNVAFALTCGSAAPNTVGLLAFTDAALPSPVAVFGVEVWVDPTVLFVPLTVTSNGIGAAEVPLPIPGTPSLAGTRLVTQFFWLGPSAPPPCPPLGLSASNALDIIVQP